MTVEQFRAAARAENVDDRSFTLAGGLPCEQYAMDASGGQWAVYYGERGCRSGLKTFASEGEALDHLLGLLIGDRTTRRKSGCPMT